MGGGVTAPLIPSLALDRSDRSNSRRNCFTPRKRGPGAHWI